MPNARVLFGPSVRFIRSRLWLSIVLILAIAVGGALLVLRSQSTGSGPDRSLQRVEKAGVLVIGLDPSYPPFENVDGQGHLVGMDVDLARELAQRIGVRAEFVSIDFGSIVDALEVGKFDVILGGVAPFPEYSKQLSYTTPYFDDGLVLIRNPRATSMVVGIESGSDADMDQDILRPKLTGYRFQQFDDQDEIRAELAQAKIAGAIVDAVTADQWAATAPGLIVEPTRLVSSPFVIATRKQDQALFTVLDSELKAMLSRHDLSALEERWLRNAAS
ncbi:MAG TPA: ABC transporter substrate-binding protein [Chloroflexota bacterium]|nr:ABC transporter substrate-binding protein [Chloroflexota bacterium]